MTRTLPVALEPVPAAWNDTALAYPEERCSHHLFEAQAARTPEATAAVFGERSLTYRELNQRANQLAHKLRALGVSADGLVGICIDRSLEMAVGVLGILKAGAAYVPLDPAYPTDRLAQILDDARPQVLVTERAHLARLPALAGAVLLIEDLASGEPPAAWLENPDVVLAPECLGYVIYTSGSTGKPKGICLSHAALVNLIEWHDRTLIRGARTLQFASLCFDASFHEMFAAWTSGGSVYFITEALRRDVAGLAQLICERQLEKVILPVIVLQQLAEHCHGREQLLGSLRELTTTGEQLVITAPIIRLFSTLPGCALHNHYGPSESHVVTAYTLPPDPHAWPSHPPIGRPIANTRIYLLDEQQKPVPIGQPGELYIAGVCLARCYLNQPALTAARFVTLRPTLRGRRKQRLYRTGDLARYRPDGNLEYLGRIDHQVKIRGFRVELGEIEAVLTRHEAVREVAVLAREDTPGDKRLVAYIVATPGMEADAAALRALIIELRALAYRKLPEYMVPAAFVVLPHLPLTPNGKLDRRALPAPGRTRPPLDTAYVAPAAAAELALAAIWEQVLLIEGIGRDDSFFALGGSSIHAAQVLERLRRTLGVELSFERFFAHPTIAALAALLPREIRAESAQTPEAVIVKAPRGRELALSYSQEQLWFLYQLAPQSRAYNCPSCFLLRGPLDVKLLARSIEQLVERHEILRTRYTAAGGRPLQIIEDRGDVQLALHDLSDREESTRRTAAEALIESEARRLFVLESGPLFRATLVRLASHEHLLLLNFHHIAIDGWSMEILLRELAASYQSLARDPEGRLPPPALQYADYAAWQRQQADSPRQRELLAYWTEQLREAPPLLELPADHPRPAVQSFRGATLSFRIEEPLTAAARRLAGQHGLTLTMVLLSAYATLLHRHTQRDEVLIGIPSAGRHRAELEGVLGFFVNTLALRIDLSGSPSFAEVLARVRTVALAAYERDELPFERLVQELRKERNPAYNPIVQLAFAPQPAAERRLALPGVDAEYVEVDARKTVFDLALYLWEEPASTAAYFEYSTDLYERPTIARLAEQLVELLRSAVAQPAQPIATLSLLSARARTQILEEWNHEIVDAPDGVCAHQLIERHALSQPDAAAVIVGEETLTYRELDRRAAALASWLEQQAVTSELRVACCLDKSAELIVAFVAIMKAGAVYVPLEPGHPRDRLQYLLADSGAAILITEAAHREKLAGFGGRTVFIEDPLPTAAAESDAAARKRVTPESALYLIYTSGSTGRPKGVVIEHRHAVAFARAQQRVVQVRPESRVLAFASPGFDASIWEMLLALTAGACLFPVPAAAALPGPELIRFLDENRISIAFLSPSALAQLPPHGLPALTTLLTGGEACTREVVLRWGEGRRLINAYGPTEATVCATMEVCSRAARTPSIGRPLDNARVYVLDASGGLVPPGVPGELCIGGASVGRGYHERAELSAQRFVPDPYAPASQAGRGLARLYRTGDLASWRADGRLEFLGRVDQQLKLRGFRIEPGEIEAVLMEHPLVRAAAVVVTTDAAGEKSLSAFLVPQSGGPQLAALPSEVQDEHVNDWRHLYDEVYERGAGAPDPTFNTQGWNSSFTGQPIPVEVMRSWVDHTVARLQSLHPQRILEIGCGTGLLLYRLAPRVERYVGLDFSAAALAQVRTTCSELGLKNVELLEREANRLHGVPMAAFDLVIVNSVVQYFPGLAYLTEVLAQAAAAVAGRGVLFIGDVRSLPLHAAFHTAAQLTQLAGELPGEALQARVARAIANDKELLIAPDYFRSLGSVLPAISHAEVWIKRGRAEDEMTRYRYDAVLYVGELEPALDVAASREWAALGRSLDALAVWLAESRPATAEVLGIPNARVYGDLHAARLLQAGPVASRVLKAASEEARAVAVEPEALFALGERLGYAVRMTPARDAGEGAVDVLFEPAPASRYPRPWRPTREPTPSVERYANDPLHQKQVRQLVPQVRSFARQKLPAYMVPASYTVLAALPLTKSGKLDRSQLVIEQGARPALEQPFVAPQTALQLALATMWRALLGTERIGIDDPFFELGGHSLLLAQLRAAIAAQLGKEVPLVKLLEHTTIRKQERYLLGEAVEPEERQERPSPHARPAIQSDLAPALRGSIAVVGVAGRFPKAEDVDELWKNLVAGIDGVTRFTAAELAALGFDEALVRSPRYVPACGVLDDAMGFDAAFFGYSPKEAQYMDPQHRAFLECAWSGLEDAGHPPGGFAGAIGVFGGAEAPRYWLERVGVSGGPWTAEDYQAAQGNLPDTLTTRVSYKLGLRGPAFTVTTACSTSLVAIHLACEHLLTRQCDLAIAGGAAIHSPYAPGHLHQDGGLLSRTGTCRPLDAEADGIVSGSGVAVVVLRRLEDALADGDHIRAVIRGSAINNDGAAKVSYMAPSIAGQLEVLHKAYAAAGLPAETVSFVELHGTGTRLGDNIEVAALRRAFAARTDERGFCALGSIKSSIGHLGAAAGVAGFIKATLALERQLIPQMMHFTTPHPELELNDSPFVVPAEARSWPRGAEPRRAAVSAFGVGGTNAHVVLEEAPPRPSRPPTRGPEVLVLSARTGTALSAARGRLAAHLSEHPEARLGEVAHTLQVGRTHFAHRHAVVASDLVAARERLSGLDPAMSFAGTATSRPPRLVFMYPGGGTQRVAMGKELYELPVYRAALDRCAELFDRELGCDLRSLIFPAAAAEAAAAAALLRPSLNCAAIFATEVALTELLRSWGVQPAAVTGHSLGEYTAAWVAGVLSLEDAVALVALRGRIYDGLGGGASMSVLLPEAELVNQLIDGTELAAVNGKAACVVSGPREAVLRLQARLGDCETRLLPIDCAAHCASVEPYLDALTARASGMRLSAPRIPMVSNLSGRYLSESEARDPAHWARHLRGTVRFAAGLSTLLADEDAVFLEVGPGWTLSTLVRRHLGAAAPRLAPPTLTVAGFGRSDHEVLLSALAQLWCSGLALDWSKLHEGEPRHRIPLPTYPFERLTYEVLPLSAPSRELLSGGRPLRTVSLPDARRVGASPAAPAPDGAGEAGAPADPLARALAALWTEVLGVAPRPRDNFFDFGGSSVTAVQLLSKLRDELKVALSVHALLERPTFAALLERVRELHTAPTVAAPTLPLLVELRRGDPTLRTPLFLIQPVGGTVYTYLALAQHLDPAQPVYGIRASGLESGEPILGELSQIVDRYLAHIQAVQPVGPYLLGGHSAGGILAFAIAQRLCAAGQAVRGLYLFDSASRRETERVAGLTLAERLAELSSEPAGGEGGVRSPSKQALLAALQDETPFRAVSEATIRAAAQLRPTALPIKLSYFLARDEGADRDPDRARDWMDLADASFALHKVAGDHFTIMEAPQVAAIAELLKLDRCVYAK